MRTFFIDCLKSLKVTRGINQYEDLASKGEQGREELKKLLQALITTCNQFNYIPDEAKQRVISQRILDDPEFYNLNASKVWHWLNGVSSKYYNTQEDKPIENAQELSAETQKLISEFMGRLLDGGIKVVPAASNAEIKAIKTQDDDRVKRKAYSAGYKPDHEFGRMMELKVQWAAECTNLLTGSLKPGCPTFEQWIEINK
jgi:hypothetical protein